MERSGPSLGWMAWRAAPNGVLAAAGGERGSAAGPGGEQRQRPRLSRRSAPRRRNPARGPEPPAPP